MEARRIVARYRALREASKPSPEAAFDLESAIAALKWIVGGRGSTKRQLFGVVSLLGNAAEKLGQDARISAALYHAANVINQTWTAKDTQDYK